MSARPPCCGCDQRHQIWYYVAHVKKTVATAPGQRDQILSHVSHINENLTRIATTLSLLFSHGHVFLESHKVQNLWHKSDKKTWWHKSDPCTGCLLPNAQNNKNYPLGRLIKVFIQLKLKPPYCKKKFFISQVSWSACQGNLRKLSSKSL